jgi:hypothetical protein
MIAQLLWEVIQDILLSGVTETAYITLGLIKFFHKPQFCLANFIDYQLSNSIAAMNGISFGAQIDGCYFDFTTIVGVDGSGGIDQTDSVLDGQAASWANLGFEASGYRNRKAGGNQVNGAGFENQFIFNGGAEIHSGR